MIWAVVRTTFEGSHCWPGAPEGPEEHLRNTHRHLFHVTVWVEQRHDNRDIEYLGFKRWLDGELRTGELGARSCEMLADEIKDIVRRKTGTRVRVEVSEDGENGALVE